MKCCLNLNWPGTWRPVCCNSNGPRGLAYYIESMVMGAGTGLAVVYYGPCTVHTTLAGAGKVALAIDTNYPFEDTVAITVTPEHAAEFDLFFRVPGWCRGATLSINGEVWPQALMPGAYAHIQRRWQAGDRLILRFDYEIRFERWEPAEFGLRAGGVAVLRGLLTYALPVKESWQRFDPPACGPGKDVVAYRVLPDADAACNTAHALQSDAPGRGGRGSRGHHSRALWIYSPADLSSSAGR
jgi:DUF1680 family protein